MASELGRYLYARRAATRPGDVGLSEDGVRRVPGLRREELALLARVSSDYYTRIEQGRVRPSSQILDAVATALGLDDIEREHLRRLAAIGRVTATGPRRPPSHFEAVGVGARELLDRLADLPAVVLGRGLDALAWTPIGGVLLGLDRSGERNMARRVFMLPQSRDLYPDWDNVAAEMVAHMRRLSVERAHDPDLVQLIGELSMGSDDFARLWPRHDVRAGVSGRKVFHHVQAGTFELEPEILTLPRDQQTLCFYRAEPGSAGAEALVLLNTAVSSGWTASEPCQKSTDRQASHDILHE